MILAILIRIQMINGMVTELHQRSVINATKIDENKKEIKEIGEAVMP